MRITIDVNQEKVKTICKKSPITNSRVKSLISGAFETYSEVLKENPIMSERAAFLELLQESEIRIIKDASVH